MGQNPSDPRKQRCDALAELLDQPDGLKVARLMQATGSLAHPEDPTAAPPMVGEDEDGEAPEAPEADGAGGEGEPTSIGIWEPRKDAQGEVTFERSYAPHINCDEFWAHTQTLHPRKTPLPIRVCFFGESVAAAMLYLPDLTLAKMIEEQLAILRGPGLFEVIDLSRVAQTPSGMVGLAVEAMQLKPDIMVFFAGNNWPVKTMGHLDVNGAQEEGELMREGGLAAIAREMYRRSESTAEDNVFNLNRIVTVAGVKAVFVIPEDNLIDWDCRQPVCWLPGDRTDRWHASYENGLAALERRAWNDAASIAQQLIDLDGGACGASQRLLGRAHWGAGRHAEAEVAFREDSAASAWDAALEFPARLIEGQYRVLRGSRHLENWTRVDLPSVFAERSGSRLAGRELFLDYCHLSYEGLKVAAATIASAILRAAGSTNEAELDWHKVLERAPAPPPATLLARALVHGASHNVDALNALARRGDLADYYLERAVEASPGVMDAMIDFGTARLSRCAPILSAGARRLHDSPYGFSTKPFALREMSAPTVRAMMRVLERHGRSVEPLLEALLRAPHGRRYGGIDLVDDYYTDLVVRVNSGATIGTPLMHEALWPRSNFFLPAEGRSNLTIEATLRLPSFARSASAAKSATIRVNGREVGSVGVTTAWKSASFKVDAALLHRGINDVEVHWPRLDGDGDRALAEILDQFESGQPAQLRPVFGELASLVVRQS
ncbi:MAG: hypothetical protein IT371_15945 [Deltaproteobacteria bacterium]|nr:hypothetical protein [Deltaproteobacteria bacterium]